MSRLFDPSLISLDNQMENFLSEMRRNNVRNFPDKDEAQFAQDLERVREGNRSVPPKQWTWKVVGLLLLGFGLAAWTYFEAMN